MELAAYTVSRDIHTDPTFARWVNRILKNRTRIINKVRVRSYKRNMKFGISIPSDTNEAETLDIVNNNDLWDNAIQKDLLNVKIAFQLLEDDEILPVGST